MGGVLLADGLAAAVPIRVLDGSSAMPAVIKAPLL